MMSTASIGVPLNTVETPLVGAVPPRFWWLKRLALIAVLGLIGLGLLRVWWGFEADRRLAGLLSQYRATGQPVLLSDFAIVKPKTKDENTAHWLVEAANSIVEGTVTVDDAFGNGFLWRERINDIEKLVAENNRALTFVRKSRDGTTCDWSLPLANNRTVSTQVWTVMSAQRKLAKLLDVAVIIYARDGEPIRAIETMRDMMFLSRSLRNHPSSTSHLVANSVERMVCTRIQRLGNDLFETMDSRGTPLDEVFEQVVVLQDELLDESEWKRQILRAGYGERTTILEETPAQGQWNNAGFQSNWLMKPLGVLQKVRQLQMSTSAAEAVNESNWIAAERILPPEPAARRETHPLQWMFGEYQDPYRGRLRSIFTVLAHKRLAGAVLAIQRFHAVNARWPDKIEELIPEYLAAIPVDPFHAKGGKITLLSDESRARLYSLGPNGVDDGGRQAPYGRGRMDFNEGDIVYFLDGRPADNDLRSRGQPPPLDQTYEDGVTKTSGSADPTKNDNESNRPEKRD